LDVNVGIEAMNVFGGSAFVDVTELARYRKLDMQRFDNLMMKEKSLALPYEDPISYGVNAARPIVDALQPESRARIELVIACTESGIDFGKSIATYLHHHLGLDRNCRLFEIKQACYSVTAGLQMAASFILSGASPGAKALVIGTDISRYLAAEGGEGLTEDWSYAEPSAGAGAVALLVSDTPRVLQLDLGANGYYGYEVMDTCRPIPDSEAGDADLSLMSYLDCCERSFLAYKKRVSEADYQETFQYLTFHTPFPGMVKGAHRAMMRKVARADAATAEADFRRRVSPGIDYCQRVGNIMGATVYLALASTIDNAVIDAPRRIGIFSYGSGCCSEFYSGVVTPEAQPHQRRFRIRERLDERCRLSMEEYELVMRSSGVVRFGTRNAKLDTNLVPRVRAALEGKQLLILREIKGFHREYEWL
jgi:polyketide biosynthesis 3-hydroxy-3-methylglutaryl-CoA synthase-like enzyme PksG